MSIGWRRGNCKRFNLLFDLLEKLHSFLVKVSYKLQRTVCSNFNKKFMYNITCRVRHVNRTTQLLNWDGYIQSNVSLSDIRVRFFGHHTSIPFLTRLTLQYQAISYFKYRTVFRRSLINYSEFICGFLNNGTFSHFFDAFRESYAKYSNVLEPCPKSVISWIN